MNYEKIKNDLISEVRLTKNQAEVFLLVTLKGKMSANQISKSLDISIDDALEISQKLVELGGFIDMPETEFEAMHPRFTAVNMYRRMCERENIDFKKNLVVDNIGIALEDVYDDARTKYNKKMWVCMGEIYRCCENPQITYLAPVNININERTIGSVDVCRWAECKKKICEEKQLGIESLTETVGMPKIEDDEKWTVIVSKLQKGKDKWKLVKLKQNGIIKYETADEKILDLKIEDYKIVDDYHNSFLVEDHLNRAVEI